MRIRDNVRTMLSTTAGIAGGGVALTGWLVKAFTPNSASAATKTVLCVATGATVGAATWGTFTFLTPATLTLVGVDVSLYTSALGAGLLSLYTGACTSASYFLAGGLGSGERHVSAAANSQRAKEVAKVTKTIPNFLK